MGATPGPAQARFEKALSLTQAARPADDDARALALDGLAELSEDRLDTLAAAKLYAQAVQTHSPFGELAAQRLLDLEGESPAIDDVVVEAARSLAPFTPPRTARLVREAAARVAYSRAFDAGAGGEGAERAAWAAAGAVQRYRVAGPFAALRLASLSVPGPLDGIEEARAPQSGPAGSTAERSLEFPDGDLGLELEPADGDLYYAASDLTAAKGGDYLLWTEGASALEVRLDGAVMLARSPWPREVPRSQTVPVRLAPGAHKLLVRWTRSEGSRLRVLLARADGSPGDLTSEAPAQLTGRRLVSNCALGSTCAAAPAWPDDRGLRGRAEALLERDPGDPLAALFLARAAQPDDRSAARAAAGQAVILSGRGPVALTLRAAITLRDAEIPDRIGRARALADLRDALSQRPSLLRARLTAAAQQRDSDRIDDAVQDLAAAEQTARDSAGAAAPLPPRLLMARSRLLDAQGNLAAARAAAQAAAEQDPGRLRCDAGAALYDFSRREGGLAEQLRLARALIGCPEQRQSLAALLRERGDLAGAEELSAKLARLRPALPQRLEQLAELQAARGAVPRAIETLRAAAALTPRSPEPLRRLAAWYDLQGDVAAAGAVREQALLRAPGDLALRRQISVLRGERLLAWSDRDAREVLKTSGELGLPDGAERPSAVRLLDHGAVEFFPGGGAVERVHTLARVLDKKAIGKFGEVQIPDGAEILDLRVLKPDGRALEPESIPEKEGHSLPGLEPGDAVEIDYLHGFAPRGPDLPGLTLGGFFFHDDETPMTESTYEVRAAPGIPLEIDPHQVEVAPVQKSAQGSRFFHSVKAVIPEQPEPNQPSDNEVAPWVQAGWGGGQKELLASMADWAQLRARPGAATDKLARDAGGRTVAEKIEKITAAIAQAVRGRSSGNDFSAPAPHVLAQGRGNRLLLLKAALASAGVRSHLALVRTFGNAPQPMRFPRSDVFTYAVLRVDPNQGDTPGAPAVWIDTTWRLGPVGLLPMFARGQPAWLLPEPGEEPALVETPRLDMKDGSTDGRKLTLDLALDDRGMASGTGRDEQRGFEAAALREALERLDGEQRRQGVEGMLGRGLRSITLDKLSVEGEAQQGGAAALLYTLKARVGRREGEALRIPASLLPSRLARRWVQKAERTRPLLLDAAERSAAKVTFALPAGYLPAALPTAQLLQTQFGSFRWEAKLEAGKLVVEEELVLPPQRISPRDYRQFAAFARAVDEAQEQELALEARAAR
jgi:tetratricopeptide (TPR) repeat protein